MTGQTMVKRTRMALALAGLAAATLLGATPAPRKPAAPLPPAGKPNWLTTMVVSGQGVHSLGNPSAPVRLTEYVSYTCSHCAHFYQTADAELRLAYVAPGKVALTVGTFIRNPVDLAVATLADCGDPSRFFARHRTFFATQGTWLAREGRLGEAQRKRWYTPDEAANMRAIVSDLGLYALVAQWGITRAGADQCLNDAAKRARIKAQHEAAVAAGVSGTPSFALNGERLVGVNDDWPTLRVLIDARLAAR